MAPVSAHRRAPRSARRSSRLTPTAAPTRENQPGALTWVPVRPTSLSRRITSQISSALFAGQIRPGDFLGTEASLAQEFGVSRMVSRDALRSLEAMGLVDIRQGARGGVRVAHGNLARFADALAIQLKLIGVTEVEALDAQTALEATSAELAASRAAPSDHERLHRLIAESERSIDDPEAFTRSAMAFHTAIAEASQNRALAAHLAALHQVMRPVHGKRTDRGRAQRVVVAHRELLARIEAGDAPGARQSMCCHLEGVRALASAHVVTTSSIRTDGSPRARARTRSLRNERHR